MIGQKHCEVLCYDQRSCLHHQFVYKRFHTNLKAAYTKRYLNIQTKFLIKLVYPATLQVSSFGANRDIWSELGQLFKPYYCTIFWYFRLASNRTKTEKQKCSKTAVPFQNVVSIHPCLQYMKTIENKIRLRITKKLKIVLNQRIIIKNNPIKVQISLFQLKT